MTLEACSPRPSEMSISSAGTVFFCSPSKARGNINAFETNRTRANISMSPAERDNPTSGYYEWVLGKHILPTLGTKKLEQITPAHALALTLVMRRGELLGLSLGGRQR
jgi:hypothetical protein